MANSMKNHLKPHLHWTRKQLRKIKSFFHKKSTSPTNVPTDPPSQTPREEHPRESPPSIDNDGTVGDSGHSHNGSEPLKREDVSTVSVVDKASDVAPAGNVAKYVHGKYAAEIWDAAFSDMKTAIENDEEANETFQKYEIQLRKLEKRDDLAQPSGEGLWEAGNLRACITGMKEQALTSGKNKNTKSISIHVLNSVKGVSSFLASMMAFCPPAAMALGGICAAIPIVVNLIETETDMISGLEYICERAPAWFVMPDLVLPGLLSRAETMESARLIKQNIRKLYRKLLEYAMFTWRQCSNKKLFRLVCSTYMDSGEWIQRLADLKTIQEDLALDIPQGHTSLLSSVLSITREGRNDLRDMRMAAEEFRLEQKNRRRADRIRDRTKLLAHLKGDDYDYQDRLEIIDDRLEGTCEWFCRQAKFRQWLGNEGGLLLLSADAGCGKSVLVKYLIKEVLPKENPEATICYFFFQDDQYSRSFTRASKAMLHCLIRDNHRLADFCADNTATIGSGEEFEQAWSAFVQTSKHEMAGPVICILDALESSDQSRVGRFLKCIKSYRATQPRAKFLFTTRGYKQILQLFSGSLPDEIHLDGDDSEEKFEIQSEINIVMNGKLANLFQRRGFDQQIQDTIRKAFKTYGSEQRTYLWMDLMFKSIESASLLDDRDWIELFQNPPSDLNETYEKLLCRVSESQRGNITVALALMLAAEKPLTLEELHIAHTARREIVQPRHQGFPETRPPVERFESWLKWECGSFVTVYNNRVYFIHPTAREFLLGNPQNGSRVGTQILTLWRGSIPHTMAHRIMSESCIALLSLDTFHRSGTKSYVEDPFTIPFASYSVKHWLDHFRRCQIASSAGVVDDVSEPFISPYLRLFIREDNKRNQHIGEKRQTWYRLMMKAQTLGRFPDDYPKANSMRRLFPYAYNLARTACLFGHVRLLKYAVEVLKADVNYQPSRYVVRETTRLIDPFFSLAHFAAYGGSDLCLRYLGQRGCDINGKSGNGRTPLRQALANGLLSTASILRELDHKVSIEYSKIGQLPPIYFLVMEKPNIDEAGADEYKRMVRELTQRPKRRRLERNETFLKAYQSSPIKSLMEGNVDINVRFRNDRTALHYSVAEPGRLFNVAFLLHAGAAVNVVDSNGDTPLHTAARAGNYAVLRLLIAYGARPNQQQHPLRGDKSGNTPLHIACNLKNRKVARVLLGRGADLDIRNIKGREIDQGQKGVNLRKILQNVRKNRKQLQRESVLKYAGVSGKELGSATACKAGSV